TRGRPSSTTTRATASTARRIRSTPAGASTRASCCRSFRSADAVRALASCGGSADPARDGARVLGAGDLTALVTLVEVVEREALANRGRLRARMASPASKRPIEIDLQDDAAEIAEDGVERSQRDFALLPRGRSSTARGRGSANARSANDESGQPDEAGDLNAEERESHRDDWIRLDQADVDQRLCDPAAQDGDAETVHGRSGDTARLEREHDRSEHREVLDAVRVRAHRPPVPVLAFDLIRTEVPHLDAAGEDPAPAIHADRAEQKQHGPHREPEQRPHRYRHEAASILADVARRRERAPAVGRR